MNVLRKYTQDKASIHWSSVGHPRPYLKFKIAKNEYQPTTDLVAENPLDYDVKCIQSCFTTGHDVYRQRFEICNTIMYNFIEHIYANIQHAFTLF